MALVNFVKPATSFQEAINKTSDTIAVAGRRQFNSGKIELSLESLSNTNAVVVALREDWQNIQASKDLIAYLDTNGVKAPDSTLYDKAESVSLRSIDCVSMVNGKFVAKLNAFDIFVNTSSQMVARLCKNCVGQKVVSRNAFINGFALVDNAGNISKTIDKTELYPLILPLYNGQNEVILGSLATFKCKKSVVENGNVVPKTVDLIYDYQLNVSANEYISLTEIYTCITELVTITTTNGTENLPIGSFLASLLLGNLKLTDLQPDLSKKIISFSRSDKKLSIRFEN